MAEPVRKGHVVGTLSSGGLPTNCHCFATTGFGRLRPKASRTINAPENGEMPLRERGHEVLGGNHAGRIRLGRRPRLSSSWRPGRNAGPRSDGREGGEGAAPQSSMRAQGRQERRR